MFGVVVFLFIVKSVLFANYDDVADDDEDNAIVITIYYY